MTVSRTPTPALNPTVGKEPLDIQDYLEAASDSARRARNLGISLVVASVLVFAALLNSLRHSWMRARLDQFEDTASGYVADRIGQIPRRQEFGGAPQRLVDDEYATRYKEYYSSLARIYIETATVIHVPFFGVAIDVNDLGLVGGLAFAIMLSMYRFTLSRELENLRTSFREAKKLGKLHEFYTLLAMRQVFTIPRTEQPMPGRASKREADKAMQRTKFLVVVPKLFTLAPLAVYIGVLWHDVTTIDVGNSLNDLHTMIVLMAETLGLVTIVTLTGMVWDRMKRVDLVWEDYWIELHPEVIRRNARKAPRSFK